MPIPTNRAGDHPLLRAFGPEQVGLDDETLLDRFLAVDAELCHLRTRLARLKVQRDQCNDHLADIAEATLAKEYGAPPTPSHHPVALLRRRPLAQLAQMLLHASAELEQKVQQIRKHAAERKEHLSEFRVLTAEVARRFLPAGAALGSMKFDEVYLLIRVEDGRPSVTVLRDWIPADSP